MLSCRDAELLIQDYLDGYLLPAQREVLEAHVRRCPGCAELLAGVSRVEERLDRLEEVEPPLGLAGAVLARLPLDAYRPSPLRRALTWGAAPVLALLVVAGVFLFEGRYRVRQAAAGRTVDVAFDAPQAASVAVVGDFNGWNPRRNVMAREGRSGVWRARLRLSPGVYQYSFVVDGREWLADPVARGSVPDGFGGRNSLLVVDG